ncbi:MarR family winged helix-turn-helix transcriptional regulator [Citromicrobium bathyomarinum]|uniref:MarR family winged helix-turn-helix transcriptional regulator n=1 Tax=Citromicrobium bathyomarinum TaxID=72174 RepID=UPI00315A2637
MQTKVSPGRTKPKTVVRERKRKRAARRPAASQRESAPGREVAAVREVAKVLLADGPHRTGLISRMVIAFADRATETERDTSRLRSWQHLLSDLAQALGQIDSEEEAKVRAAANALRKSIRMIDRNPEGRLAVRPASRRILEALHELGGSASFAETRTKSRHAENHFSNSLKSLLAHELVEVRKDESDRRRKALLLTARGRASLAAAKRTREAHAAQDDHRHVTYGAERVVTRSSTQSYPAPRLEKIYPSTELAA